MFPKIYYSFDVMKEPQRCYDGIIVAIGINGNTNLNIEGKEVSATAYLINESELFQIKSDNTLLFYFPSSLFKNINVSIFNHYFYINNQASIKSNLIQLFNYLKRKNHGTQDAQNLLNEILHFITHKETIAKAHSTTSLSNIVTYIYNHLDEKITLESIANYFFMSSSNISNLFKNIMNISFYKYVTSLRVSKSIADLLTTNLNIEIIARKWGYANATNYIMHFKKYMGKTPKRYRTLQEDYIFYDTKSITSKLSVLQNIDFSEKPQRSPTHVSINDKKINQPEFSYFNLIDIGSYENLNFILNEEIFTYKNFDQYKVASYIYISDPIDNLMTGDYEKKTLRLRNLLKTKVSISIKVKSMESFYFIQNIIEELHFLESEHLASSNIRNGNILLLVDLTNLKISEIKNIQRNLYETKILLSIDISEYFLKGHKSISPEIKNLNPDFYYIDFTKINTSLYKEMNDTTFKTIQSNLHRFLDSINANKNIIFLNHETIYPNNVLTNIGNFLEQSILSKKYLAGASIHFNKNVRHHISIFDETENKTLFFFLGIMLLNFSRYKCQYGENYLTTKNLHSYNILLYNSDNTITNNIEDCTQTFYIDFDQDLTSNSMLVSTELLNNNYGSIEGIIDANVANQSSFPNSLKFKLSQYNAPLFKIKQHNFKDGAFVIKLPPRSVMMVTIYI